MLTQVFVMCDTVHLTRFVKSFEIGGPKAVTFKIGLRFTHDKGTVFVEFSELLGILAGSGNTKEKAAMSFFESFKAHVDNLIATGMFGAFLDDHFNRYTLTQIYSNKVDEVPFTWLGDSVYKSLRKNNKGKESKRNMGGFALRFPQSGADTVPALSGINSLTKGLSFSC